MGHPLDLSHFQEHAPRRWDEYLCNSGEAAGYFFIQQNNHFCAGGRVCRSRSLDSLNLREQ